MAVGITDTNPASDAEPEIKTEAKKQETKMADSKPEDTAPKGATQNRDTKEGRSEAHILEKANRIARKKVAAEMAKVAKALGLENADAASLNAKLAELEKGQTASLDVTQRYELRIRDLETEVQNLRSERDRTKTELNRAKREREKEARRRKDMEVEAELRETARNAGIQDVNYALHLLTEEVKANPDAQLDHAKFFESLKLKPNLKHLFREEAVMAGPKPGLQDTPVSTSPAPQGNAPAAPNKAGQLPAEDVEAMPKHEFNQRTVAKYGFRPGL